MGAMTLWNDRGLRFGVVGVSWFYFFWWPFCFSPLIFHFALFNVDGTGPDLPIYLTLPAEGHKTHQETKKANMKGNITEKKRQNGV